MTAASASGRSPSAVPASRDSTRLAATASDAGISASASSAASRTWASSSRRTPEARIAARRSLVARDDQQRIAPDPGRRVLQRRRRPPPPPDRAVERPQAVQGPEGMDRAGVQADGVDGRGPPRAGSGRARRRALPRSTSRRWACSRQNRLSFFKRRDQRPAHRPDRARTIGFGVASFGTIR